jgi:hypothetical protein
MPKLKKEYRKPKLIEYGRVRDITMNTTRSTNKDGSNNGVNSRT